MNSVTAVNGLHYYLNTGKYVEYVGRDLRTKRQSQVYDRVTMKYIRSKYDTLPKACGLDAPQYVYSTSYVIIWC